MADPDLSEFEQLDELAELRKLLGATQDKLRRANAKTADLIEAVYKGARDASLYLGNPPAVPKPAADKRTKRAEVALLHLSDWQIGKVTTSYNTVVARDRLRRLGEKVARLTEIERADHPVRECHVLLGGDMVEGTAIFPGQAHLVDSNLFEQTFQARSAIVELIRHLLTVFETVHVWEEPGNHGRLGRKGDYAVEDNQDIMVYRLARDQLENEKRLVWNETQGWHSIVSVGNYRVLFVHGDEIRSFGGQTPAFGITRKVNAWATGVVEPFNDCYMGHWHQPLVLPIAHGRGRTFVNPSIESDNTYAQEFVGASGTPGQRLNFIDPEKGRVTTERVVWLDS
jgi:Archaeal DNA polymerase II, small subunit/DNA polymerase delta, subunit B